MKSVALFRGINVGGRRKVAMADLRDVLVSLGMGRVETYVQSGNAVFEVQPRDTVPGAGERLARDIEAAFERAFGFSAVTIIVGGEELAGIVASNPFVQAGQEPGSDLYVTFLREQPRGPAADADVRRSAGVTADEFVVAERHVYLRCPGGYARTKLSNTLFEKTLAVAATTRNWRTVTRLSEMAGAPVD